jgi:hypothetical protein
MINMIIKHFLHNFFEFIAEKSVWLIQLSTKLEHKESSIGQEV